MADATRHLIRTLNKAALAVLPEAQGVQVSHGLRAWEERNRFRRADLAVLSHAKSGRTWLRVMISRLFQLRYGLSADELLEFDNYHEQNPAIPRIQFSHGHYLGPLFDSPDSLAKGAPRRIVFLARDPRDIAVSQYFHFQKRTKQYKRKLQRMGGAEKLSIFEFVIDSPMGLPGIIDYLNEWVGRLATRDDVLIVSYEALRANAMEHLGLISEFLGFGFNVEEIKEAAEFASFERMKEKERTGFFAGSRVAPGDRDDPDSYKVRRAVVGGYRDYFDADELAQVDALVRERLSPELAKRWSEPADGD